jgi:hypothetical protein
VSNVTVDCAECAVEFCLTPSLYQRRRDDGKGFYCPNGHSNVFRPTPDQERIKELEKRLAQRDRVIEDWHKIHDEIYAQREELIRAIKECPGHCGWKSTKQIPRDPVAMGRGIERVRLDVAEHLMTAHGGAGVAARRELPERV